MVHSMFQYNKGIYSIVTTFFFIIIILVAVFSVMYSGAFILGYKKTSNDELNSYIVAASVKDRLYFCFGKIFDTVKLDTTQCTLSPGLAKGYSIQQIAYGNCSAKNWTFSNTVENPSMQEIYMVPIQNGGLVCPGKVQVFI